MGMCPEFTTTSRLFFSKVMDDNIYFKEFIFVQPDGTTVHFDTKEEKLSFLSRTTTRYKFDSFLCLHINFRLLANGNYTRSIMRNSVAPVVFTVSLNDSFREKSMRELAWFMSEPGHLPMSVASLMPGHIPGKWRSNAFQRRESNLLQYPFKTACRDYQAEKLVSQEQCIRYCLVNAEPDKPLLHGDCVSVNGQQLTHDLLGIPYSRVDDRLFEPSDLFTYNELQHPLVKRCNSECSQIGCRLVTYFSYSVTEVNWIDQSTAVGIQLPVEPDLIVNYKPKLTVSEYAALLGSIFGLWLGMSMFSLVDLGFWFFNLKRAHRECKMQSNRHLRDH